LCPKRLDNSNKLQDQKHQKELNKHIIPELYTIGKQLRTNQHLYKSYKNIIERILKYKEGTMSQSGKRVAVALTASERFERLGDRIELLVLSSIDEAIAEKDALMNTVCFQNTDSTLYYPGGRAKILTSTFKLPHKRIPQPPLNYHVTQLYSPSSASYSCQSVS
jgi:hypothetical protein